MPVERGKQTGAHETPSSAAEHAQQPASQAGQQAGAAAVQRIAGKAVVFTTADYYENRLSNMISRVLVAPVQYAEAGYFRSQGYEVVETHDLKVLRDALTDPNVKAVAINSHGESDAMMDEDNNESIFVDEFGEQPGLGFARNDGQHQQLHVDELIVDGCDTADDHGDTGFQKASGAKMFMGNEGHSDPYSDMHFALRLAVSRLTGKSPAIDNKTTHYRVQRFVDAHPNLPSWLKQLLTP